MIILIWLSPRRCSKGQWSDMPWILCTASLRHSPISKTSLRRRKCRQVMTRCFHAAIRPKAEFKANECFNLTPISGNIHCFLAKEDSIFLDILTPYYSEERPCSFYSIIESKPKAKCQECIDFKRKMFRPDERDLEISEVEIDDTLPSSEFRDIDLFEKYNLQKIFKSSKAS
jgi:hypothetical protein